MTYIHRLEIPIDDSILCLAYSGAAEKLLKAYPSTILNSEWYEIEEYRKIENFLREQNTDSETMDIMLGQLRATHVGRGPTLTFQIPATEACPAIQGSFNRWGFTFKSAQPLPPEMDAAISTFCIPLALGQ